MRNQLKIKRYKKLTKHSLSFGLIECIPPTMCHLPNRNRKPNERTRHCHIYNTIHVVFPSTSGDKAAVFCNLYHFSPLSNRIPDKKRAYSIIFVKRN
jgi:hypothetical protein